MDMQDYANLGSAVLTGNPSYVGAIDKQALHARNHSDELRRLLAYAVPTPDNLRTRIDGPIVGWTTPALTFDKMKQINGSAMSLNFDIEHNIKPVGPRTKERAAFKGAWNTWFEGWQNFFKRYQTSTGKLGSLFDTDLLAAQTESYRLQLVGDPKAPPKPDGRPGEPGWIGAYEAESTAEQPLPPTTAHAVPKVDPPPPGDQGPGLIDRLLGKKPPGDKETDEGMPWWLVALFVTGGVGLVAGSFFIIRRKVIQGQQAESVIRKDVLPLILGSSMGPTGVALASASNRFAPANDPARGGGPTFASNE